MPTMSELLITEEKWTKGKNGRDKDGHSVSEKSQECVCRCLYGVAHTAYPDPEDSYVVVIDLQDVVLRYFGTSSAASEFNDQIARFEDVKALVNHHDGLISEKEMVDIFRKNPHFIDSRGTPYFDQDKSAVTIALKYMKAKFPQTTQVFFDSSGRWFFMNEDSERIVFDPRSVDLSILEAAADEVADSESGFPAAFAI